MLVVSQGHEKSIAIEIFIKSSLELSPKELKEILFVVEKDHLSKNLKDLHIKFEIKNRGIIIDKKMIPCHFINTPETSDNLSISSASLLEAIKLINSQKDLLITLPTSKDQLLQNGAPALGYTEYFRGFFKNKNIAMNFLADQHQIMLITDHLPLANIPSAITTDLIVQKTVLSLEGYKKFFNTINEIYFAGINPHAGEQGLLGREESAIIDAIKTLYQKYPHKKFEGPISADTLHLIKPQNNRLFVYMYHDQGLAPFKAIHGFSGLNLSFGLPFLRLSVDHGTAFSLYGKNLADHHGCSYVLKNALLINEKLFQEAI